MASDRMKGYKYREVVKILTQNGYEKVSQTGTHVKYKKDNIKKAFILPNRAGEVSRPLIRRMFKEHGLEERC